MIKPSTMVYSVAFILAIYYGTALVCLAYNALFSPLPWMGSFLYIVFGSEPVAIIFSAMARIQWHGFDPETLSFASYLVVTLGASFSLLMKKSWARKFILVTQGIRFLVLLLLALLTHISAQSFTRLLGGLFLFLLPSGVVWYILTRPSVKKEFLSAGSAE